VLCPTPRASHHEELIAGALVGFAAERGLTSSRDARNNVIIYKPGTGKYADTKIPVILQAHTDMICVPVTADFSAGVEAFYSSENRLTGRSAVTKEKTSLGADDGIGVATALAVLDCGGDEIVHPPIVAVFTVEEECGLTGAQSISADAIVNIAPGLDFSRAAFINLDDGRFGQFSVGCAGSVNVKLRTPVERIGLPLPNDVSYLDIVISGLTGGHSGLSIHENRGNANIILCEVIYKLLHAGIDLYVFGFGRCGDASNAIPSEASVYAAVPDDQVEIFRKAAEEAEFYFRDALKSSDDDLRVEIRDSVKAKEMAKEAKEGIGHETPYTKETLLNIASLAKGVKNGPIAFCAAMPQLVETSSNLGIIKDEGPHIVMEYMARSSIDAELEKVLTEISRVADRNHADMEISSRSPGWAYREKSALRDLFLNKYKQLFGEEATAAPVHAGLECGHFAQKFDRFKDMEFISCGPTTTEIHSVNETLHTETVEKFGRLIIEVLGNLYS